MALFIIGDLHFSLSTNKPMDIFGEEWKDHHEKISEKWLEMVCEEDTVIVAGDISWGMSLNEALCDLKFIDKLPGKKILMKGNHDYWWETITKMHGFLQKHDIRSIDFLYNNHFMYGDIAICGSRGWTIENNRNEQDTKIINREAGRLELSLASAPANAKKIAVLHYPPVFLNYVAHELIEKMNKYDVSDCYYGHLHGHSIANAFIGVKKGINFHLVSADSIDFCVLNIIE